MKDMFEEKLKARMEELESDTDLAATLPQERIWQRIEAAQKPERNKIWLPRIYKLTAAVVICLGIALLFYWQQADQQIVSPQATLAKAVVPDSPKSTGYATTVVPVVETQPVPETKAAVQPGKVSSWSGNAVVQQASKSPVQQDTKTPEVPQIIHPEPLQKESPAIAKAGIVYLSDLEKEEPLVAKAPRKPANSHKLIRYMKSNLEDYAVAPPVVIINQILNK